MLQHMDHFDVMNIIIFTAKVDTLTHKNEDVAVHSTTQVLAAFLNLWPVFFFYLGFLSRTLTNHRTAGEW